MRTGFISMKEILSEVLRQGGDIVKNTNEDDVIMDTSELIGIIGMPALFEDKVAEIEIHKYRAKLPCDVYEVKQIKCTDELTLNASTDMFDIEHSRTNAPTYKIQNDILIVSFEEGKVLVSYRAFVLDDDGFPMVPNDPLFKRALISYIIYKKVYNEYINGKVPSDRIMERVETNYELNIAQASRRFELPTIDECDNVRRMMNSFIFRSHSQRIGYKDIGDENISSIKQ